jgi:hypothetical protein
MARQWSWGRPSFTIWFPRINNSVSAYTFGFPGQRRCNRTACLCSLRFVGVKPEYVAGPTVWRKFGDCGLVRLGSDRGYIARVGTSLGGLSGYIQGLDGVDWSRVGRNGSFSPCRFLDTAWLLRWPKTAWCYRPEPN